MCLLYHSLCLNVNLLIERCQGVWCMPDPFDVLVSNGRYCGGAAIFDCALCEDLRPCCLMMVVPCQALPATTVSCCALPVAVLPFHDPAVHESAQIVCFAAFDESRHQDLYQCLVLHLNPSFYFVVVYHGSRERHEIYRLQQLQHTGPPNKCIELERKLEECHNTV